MEPALQSRAEGNKLLHDTMKQLITISSGSIVIMLTFWEKVFTQHLWKAAVGVAFVGFLICIIAALLMIIFISLKMGAGYAPDAVKKYQKREDLAYPIAAMGFLLAILALVVFVIRNLLEPTAL